MLVSTTPNVALTIYHLYLFVGAAPSPRFNRLEAGLLHAMTSLPGGHSEWVPPESISNSEVKTLCADDSAAFAV